MTVYKILKRYNDDDNIEYYVMPYDAKGTLRWCGIKFFLKNCFLSEKRADKKCTKLNNHG